MYGFARGMAAPSRHAQRRHPRRAGAAKHAREWARAGYVGGKQRKGSKAHIAVDTFGQLLRVVITPANAQERAQVGELCERVPAVTGQPVQVGFVDQGCTGEETEYAAVMHRIDLQLVKKPDGQTGFVLRPRRWVVERRFVWLRWFRQLARYYERLSSTLR